MKTRYQLPGVDNRQRETWNHLRAYEAPVQPLEIPTDDDSTVEVEEAPEPVPITEAVPVRIMNFAKEPDRFRDFRAFQLTIAPGSVVALARRHQRTRITLRVESAANTDIVYIGHEPTVTEQTGYPLYGGDRGQQITAQSSVYVTVASGAAAPLDVAVIEEFITELK